MSFMFLNPPQEYYCTPVQAYALEEAGYSNVKLYSGSWSDSISYEENPVATGEK